MLYFSKTFIRIFIIKVVMAKKYINLRFPFKDSVKGFFIDLTETDADAIKSDLMHLILTNKGERLYLPEFGTNLKKFIFEPNDSFTQSSIKAEITEAIKNYMPNLKVNQIIIEQSPSNEHVATVQVDYTITEDVFDIRDTLIIEL